MARSRNIKPGFFKNEILGEADPIYSLLFAGLWTIADKEGRLEYRPKKIKAEIFPYRFELDVCLALAWLKHESFITVYEIDQKEYIQINNWRKHQAPHHKELDSEIPPPPKEEKKQLEHTDTHACAKQGPSLSQDQSKQIASCPTDSLNLIPDSLNPKADSLNPIPDSHQTPPCNSSTVLATNNDEAAAALKTKSRSLEKPVTDWEPSQEIFDTLQSALHGVPEKFIREQLPEFKIYWRDRDTPAVSWDSKFLNWVSGQWKRKGHAWTPEPAKNRVDANDPDSLRKHNERVIAEVLASEEGRKRGTL